MTELERYDERIAAARAAYEERLVAAIKREATAVVTAVDGLRQAGAVALRDLNRGKNQGAAVEVWDAATAAAWSEAEKIKATAQRDYAKEKDAAGKALIAANNAAAEELGGKR